MVKFTTLLPHNYLFLKESMLAWTMLIYRGINMRENQAHVDNYREFRGK